LGRILARSPANYAGYDTSSFTLLAQSYQHVYGNIYTNTTDVFHAQYAPVSPRCRRAGRPLDNLRRQKALVAANAVAGGAPAMVARWPSSRRIMPVPFRRFA
jgi:hypothetical protein